MKVPFTGVGFVTTTGVCARAGEAAAAPKSSAATEVVARREGKEAGTRPRVEARENFGIE